MKKTIQKGLMTALLILGSYSFASEKIEIKTKYETIEGEKKQIFICGLKKYNLTALNLEKDVIEPSPFECLSQVVLYKNEILATHENVWYNTSIKWDEYVNYLKKLGMEDRISDGWSRK